MRFRKVSIVTLFFTIVYGDYYMLGAIPLAHRFKLSWDVVLFYIPLALVPFWAFIFPRIIDLSGPIVRFTSEGVLVGGQLYKYAEEVSIQFRSIRHPYPPREYDKTLKRAQKSRWLYPVEFHALKQRVVEMIYGARIIEITIAKNEELAEKWAIALQLALERSISRTR